MWGHNVNMAAAQMEFILYDKNYNLGDDLNCEVKLTCLLYSKTCVSWPPTVPEKVANIGRWPSYRNLPQNR
jgi:hypothetical protein